MSIVSLDDNKSLGLDAAVYLGNLYKPSLAESSIDHFLGALYTAGIADSKAALIQVCEGCTGDQIFGLIAAASADFSTVHKAIGEWSDGKCADTSTYAETIHLNNIIIATVHSKFMLNPIGSKDTARKSSFAVDLAYGIDRLTIGSPWG